MIPIFDFLFSYSLKCSCLYIVVLRNCVACSPFWPGGGNQSRPGDMREGGTDVRRYEDCSKNHVVCLPKETNILKKASSAGRSPDPHLNPTGEIGDERLRRSRNSLQALFTSWLLSLASLAFSLIATSIPC